MIRSLFWLVAFVAGFGLAKASANFSSGNSAPLLIQSAALSPGIPATSSGTLTAINLPVSGPDLFSTELPVWMSSTEPRLGHLEPGFAGASDGVGHRTENTGTDVGFKFNASSRFDAILNRAGAGAFTFMAGMLLVLPFALSMFRVTVKRRMPQL